MPHSAVACWACADNPYTTHQELMLDDLKCIYTFVAFSVSRATAARTPSKPFKESTKDERTFAANLQVRLAQRERERVGLVGSHGRWKRPCLPNHTVRWLPGRVHHTAAATSQFQRLCSRRSASLPAR